jgi:dipeptidyl aminopeptidase/acylaminoacyl peptidase
MKNLLTLLIFSFCVSSFAQKKVLTHADYDLWKRTATKPEISHSGHLVAISVITSTEAGDGYLEIYNIANDTKHTFFNGVNPQISADEDYIYFLQKPPYEKLRKEKKDEVAKEKQSKDTFMVYEVASGTIIDSIQRVKKYTSSDKRNEFLIVEKYKDLKPENKNDSTTVKETSLKEIKKDKKRRLKKERKEREKKAKESKEPADKRNKTDYTKEDYLIVYQPVSRTRDRIDSFKDYEMPREGTGFIYSRKQGKKKKDQGVYYYDSSTRTSKTLLENAWRYKDLSIDKYGKQLAYKVAMDSAQIDSLKFELYYQKDLNSFTRQLGYGESNIKDGWKLTEKRKADFSENGKRLLFYIQPKMEYTMDTTLMEDEIAQVDVWNYKDRMTQPEQKTRMSSLERQSATVIWDTEKGTAKFLNNYDVQDTEWDDDSEGNYIIYTNNDKYDISRSWEYPWRADYLVENLTTRSKKFIINNSGSSPIRNPKNTHAVYFNYDTQDWHMMNLETQIGKNLTKFLQVSFAVEDDDHPALADDHGFGGFDKDGFALVFDKYDVWKLDVTGVLEPKNITKTGRQNKITYRTENLEKENSDLVTYFDGKLLLSAFDHGTKANSLMMLGTNGIEPLYEVTDRNISAFAKAEKTDALLIISENFKDYPDVEYLTPTFKKPLTDMNPQEKDFKWGTVELFQWNAYDGVPLEGLIYKPEDFDPKKKYPMIVYFYEKYADRLHSYRAPLPSASTVNFTYLTSNDYVVFVPDIVYKDGHPGQSAYNCIVSGTEAVEKLGYVDSNKMALQGQSWGGYQTAYLVTVTNKYAAAMAGAPVSNMTSAYGGIRWGSGLSRAFQYEKTQTRIGKNLWDGLDLYIENSPLFHIPKIETPLLMMHNDEDGAVPYYQGIEMFMGMRRWNKPSWLLVYNEEAHNLRKMKNKRDLSVRMMQFFDHYLKNEPAPLWMTEGVSRDKKGKQTGYEFSREKTVKK